MPAIPFGERILLARNYGLTLRTHRLRICRIQRFTAFFC